MKKAVIYYFSGTGNTELVTQMLADNLRDNDYDVTVSTITKDTIYEEIESVKESDLFGIAYPVYGFGASKIINKFIKKLPKGQGQRTFILNTSGGYSAWNIGAACKPIRKLENKNYKVVYDRTIVMGSNFYIHYGDRLTKSLYLTAQEKAKHMAEELAQGKVRGDMPGFFMNCLVCFINFMEDNFGAWTFGASLRADKNCSKCMKCINNCPNNNIRLKNDRIKIGTSCLFCMKCVYACPDNAIVSAGLNFCVLKDGYDIHRIAEDESIEPYRTEEIKDSKLNVFYEYIANVEK